MLLRGRLLLLHDWTSWSAYFALCNASFCSKLAIRILFHDKKFRLYSQLLRPQIFRWLPTFLFPGSPPSLRWKREARICGCWWLVPVISPKQQLHALTSKTLLGLVVKHRYHLHELASNQFFFRKRCCERTLVFSLSTNAPIRPSPSTNPPSFWPHCWGYD